MKPLIPIEAYRAQVSSISTARLGLATGLFFSVLMALGFVVAFAFLPADLRRSLPWTNLGGMVLLAGAAFGFLFPLLLKSRLLKTMEAVYSETGPYRAPVPQGPFTFSFPCNLLRGKLEVGGVLYLGHLHATFAPHSMNLPQHRDTVEIARGHECTVHTIERQGGFATRLVGQAPQLLEVASPLGVWRINVPQASRWVPEIRSLLGSSGGGGAVKD